MIRPAENHPARLNSATLGADRNRFAHGGLGFAAINAMFAPARSPRDGIEALNVAPVPSDRMLAELNTLHVSPRLAAALASLNAADDAHQSQQQSNAEDAHRAELTRNAQKLISQTFFGPMLRQMRNSPFKSELFSGGRGGEVFNTLFDQQIADRMASGTNNRLVAAVVRRLEKIGKPPVASNPFENVRIHVAPGFGS